MSSNKKLVLVFVMALFLRLFLVFVAYHGDLNNNISWGTLAVEKGLTGYYEGEGWPYSAPNQPPLTILMFASTRVIWLAVQSFTFPWQFWQDKGMIFLVKLPSILADLGIGWLIYKYLFQKKKKFAFPATAIWLFNPVIWYNSAIWGQTDSIVNLLGLVSVLALLKKNLVLSFLFLVLSLLLKGSLAIFVPVLIFVAILQKHKLADWFKAVACGLSAVVLTSVWFHPSIDIFAWLINLYQKKILPGEIGFLTANAFNFWWLVNPGKILDSVLYFGLPARVWGFGIAMMGIFAILFWLQRKRLTDKRIFISLILVSLITFLFMTRIHERYLYPFFPMATILLGLIPGMVVPYIIFSITYFLNLYHLFWVPSFAPLEALYQIPAFAQSISLINILTLFYLLRQFCSTKI
jgi:Gpi18-like mannosyltransferase